MTSTQQMRSIYAFIISSLVWGVTVVQAQKSQASDLTKNLFLNGITIQADVASLTMPLFTKGETYGGEGGIQIDIRHKYYPVFELGFGGSNKISDDDIRFDDYGLYGRLGVDFNIIKQSKDSKPTNNLFLAGARLGMSNFRYNISNILINDNYWGGSQILDYTGIGDTKLWFEIVAGVKVEIIKNIYMGWNIRNKHLLKSDKPGEVSAWYIPGYGRNAGSAWGFSYVIGYHFNTK